MKKQNEFTSNIPKLFTIKRKIKYLKTSDWESTLSKLRDLALQEDLYLLTDLTNVQTFLNHNHRIVTTLDINYSWLDVISGNRMTIPFIGQGTHAENDLSMVDAISIGERCFLSMQFDLPYRETDDDFIPLEIGLKNL